MIYFGNLPWYKIPFDAFQMPFYSKKVEKYGLKNPKWIENMRSRGLEVHYWTIDNYKDIKKAFSIGASGVITNRPKLAYELLTQMGKRYVDADDTIELLCTKPGEGSLGLGDALLTIKESKPLPASD